MTTLADSVAVVTGAGSGIGFALASAAVRHGCKVVLADIRDATFKLCIPLVSMVYRIGGASA